MRITFPESLCSHAQTGYQTRNFLKKKSYLLSSPTPDPLCHRATLCYVESIEPNGNILSELVGCIYSTPVTVMSPPGRCLLRLDGSVHGRRRHVDAPRLAIKQRDRILRLRRLV